MHKTKMEIGVVSKYFGDNDKVIGERGEEKDDFKGEEKW